MDDSPVPPGRAEAREVLEAVEQLRRQPPAERVAVLSRMPPEQALAVFRQLEPGLQEELLEYLPDAQAQRLVEELDPDDRVRLLEILPAASGRRVIAGLTPREQRLTHRLLAFPPQSAGRIMSPEYLPLDPGVSVERALAMIREQGRSVETVDVLPVLERSGRLAGLAMLSELVLAQPGTVVGDLMLRSFPSVLPDTDQEEVARLIQAADLLALPVIDPKGHLLGLITVDDAMDVLQLENEEDLARSGASEPLDRPYFAASLVALTKARLVWLLLLAVAGALTVNILNAFEWVLEQVIALSLFIPLLIGIGGNSGAQSATTVVRALATGELEGRKVLPVMMREARVGGLLGGAVAILAYFPVMLFFGSPLAATVSLTLVAICIAATLVGSGMPLLATRVGVDPAVVSAPVVTTLVDATGLLVYFLIAQAIMGL